MRCSACSERKISSEFLKYPGRMGNHASCEFLHSCLECLKSSIQNSDGDPRCPDCKDVISESTIKDVFDSLDSIQVRVLKELKPKTIYSQDMERQGSIFVSLLSGASHEVELCKFDSIPEVKLKIQQKIGVNANQMRLIYKKAEIPPSGAQPGPWSSYGIPYGETIHAMILLYEVKPSEDSVQNIDFQLSWQPPRSNDSIYIDAACIVLNRSNQLLGCVTFDENPFRKHGILHSGASKGKCIQTLQVDVRKLPPDAQCLCFTLAAAPNRNASTWRYVTLADFSWPMVTLRDSFRGSELATYNIPDAGYKECVIMAMINRQPNGCWTATGIGRPCDGNAYRMDAMIASVTDLLRASTDWTLG